MSEFSMGLIGALIACALFSLNNKSNFYPESVEYANKVCESNEGWDQIQESGMGTSKAICRNGAEFTYDWPEVRSKKP